jgi:hypothetical protein
MGYQRKHPYCASLICVILGEVPEPDERCDVSSDIIEEIVKWRMGSAYDSPILDWRDSRLNFDSEFALDVDLAGGVMIERDDIRLYAPRNREKHDPSKHKRLVDVARDISNARADQQTSLSLFLAMQDARLFPSFESLGPAIPARCVQISYARTVDASWRSQTELVLWPLSDYVKWWRLPRFLPVPWGNRQPELLWRGQPTGMSYELSDEAQPILTGIRKIRRWLNGWLKDEAESSEECFWTWAKSYQRIKAIDICRHIQGTNVRLVPMYDGNRRSLEVVVKFLGAEVASERITADSFLAMQQQYKYVLSLPGNDYPSSLRQDLVSGSLVLMPKPFWEGVWFYGLKPNVHYIPLRADLADLEEKLQWCRDNDGACKEMAEAARAFALEYFEPSLERAVQARMVERLARMTALGSHA